jgi:hypothetical protein
MPIQKTIRIIFLAVVVFVELILTFASTFYVPWYSMSFLGVVLCSAISIAAIIYYVLKIDQQDSFVVMSGKKN